MKPVLIKKRSEKLCQDCGKCIMNCPMECFESTIEKDDFEKCCSCGLCLRVCKVHGAIEVNQS